MRKWSIALAALLAGLATLLIVRPRLLRAQENCNVAQGSGGTTQVFGQGTPSQATYMGGGVTVTCPESGRVIKADSMVMLANGDQRLLIGHAYYSDKEKTLTADQINYMGAQKHMFAQFGGTNPMVQLVDKVNGAIIRGQYMDYTPAQGGKESHAIIYSQSGRPHAVLRGKTQGGAPAPAAAAADTAHPDTTQARPARPAQPDTSATLVDADRMEITGQKAFHAIGNVVITRSDMKGAAQDALYDPDADHLKLSGSAKVTGDQFSLTGGTIDGNLVGNEFKDVTATFQAELQSKDLRVKSPAMTIAFDKGQVQRMVALSAERAKRTATDGKVLAEAFAKDFHLVADSIDAKAPGQKIEQVVAVGRAYGERQNDSIKVKMPEIASKDWLRGDTITGYFTDASPKARQEKGGKNAARNGNGKNAAPAPKVAGKPADGAGSSPADSTERVLERIVAVGNDANAPASS
ncbi:MAG TPA: LptA/OstA family protein, partial [Longimicrobiales bacterium]